MFIRSFNSRQYIKQKIVECNVAILISKNPFSTKYRFQFSEVDLKLHGTLFRPGSCTSELQLKVNCRIKFGLARPTVGRPDQILFYNLLSVCKYNSLSAAIHVYMIRLLMHYGPDHVQVNCC